MTSEEPSPLRTFRRARARLREMLEPRNAAHSTYRSRHVKLAAACAVIFFTAAGVRLLHWQDTHLASGLGSLTHRYLKHAENILDGGGMLFPRDFDHPGNVQLLVHPPGYSIFVAAVFGLFGNSQSALTVAQILADSASVVLVALIAAELFPFAVAVLAGLIAAFSPHLSHYSLFLLPDALAALPILAAIYLIIRARERPRLVLIIGAGILMGVSCWLRSNALLLVAFVAIAVWLLFDRDRRLKYSLWLMAATVITILPITVRNLVVFGKFIPLSLGAGITLVEGIADYDDDKRFGMPRSDLEGKWKDVEWHNRIDYSDGLWKPDGIYRDQYRFSRGLEVIRANPWWFAGVMIRRAAFMLRYNSPVSEGWPFDTARVPVVSLEPGFGHKLVIAAEAEPAWATSSEELKATGGILAPQAEVTFSPDAGSLLIAGDASEFGDQFASAPIAVEKNSDYILRLSARYVRGPMAVKVTSADRRIALASALISEPEESIKQKARRDYRVGAADSDEEDDESADEGPASPTVIDMPFATGNRSEALIVISNNGKTDARPVMEVGEARLYRLGPTPATWTRIIRPLVRGIERNLYTTARMIPLIVMGIALLVAAARKKALLVLLVVPAYYLCVQSAFHTEYRYILAIHYFLFVLAAVTLFCAGKLIKEGARLLIKQISR